MSTTATPQHSPAMATGLPESPSPGVTLLPTSTLARKYVMAISGAVLTIFVIGHMLGNMQVFLGRETLNKYAHFLKSNPELLWPARIGLLAFLILHLWMAISLNLRNKKARPIGYAFPRNFETADVSSRNMFLTGLVILAFLIYHLLHFTLGVTNPGDFALKDHLGHQDVYGMVIMGFRNPLISIAYIIAQLFLGLHLWHGVPSMFQTLGINRVRWEFAITRLGQGVAIIIVGGNILMPLLILLGIYPEAV